jgi:hypothetical protein
MRYRLTIFIGILTVFLSSPTYTNGQTKYRPGEVAKVPVLDGPPDLAVNATASPGSLSPSTEDSISALARLSISIINQLTHQSNKPLLLFGSDASPVTLRITLPSEGTLFFLKAGNIGVDSGFTCKIINNNVLCTGGTIAAGREAHISVDVAGNGAQAQCSTRAPVTVEVDPVQNEVNLTNNTATIYDLYVVNPLSC